MGLLDILKNLFKMNEAKEETVKQEVKEENFPEIDISEEIQNEVSNLVEYVYAKGKPPSDEMPSKKHQKYLLARLYMSDLGKYEKQANSVYENTLSKENAYAQVIDEDEFTEQMHFAMESLCLNMIWLSQDNKNARKYWSAMDNLSERLLQINHDKFKKLFILMHEWHFGWVYKFDIDYKYMLKHIKGSLNVLHGIKQTDFYNIRIESKTDLQFTLYYAEQFGEIKRVREGRTYRLYLPEDNVEEIPKYEFTASATTDGNFDYKKYWKEVEKKLRANLGIRQADFYKLFPWDYKVVACTLRAAEKDGKVIREGKGNSYLLYLPKKEN